MSGPGGSRDRTTGPAGALDVVGRQPEAPEERRDVGRDPTLVEASGGPSLIAPLTDAARNKNLTALAGEFAKYARKLRRSPIKRTRVQARKVRPPRR